MRSDMTNSVQQHPHVVIIGAGFTGLAAAYELAKAKIPVTVLEQDSRVGGGLPPVSTLME